MFEYDREPKLTKERHVGLLNLASQGLESIPPAVYSTLLPRSSPYHPSRRNPSSYRRDPEPSYSFHRSEDETAWFEQRDLRSLNLANNELTRLDEEVGGFEELEFLDVSLMLLHRTNSNPEDTDSDRFTAISSIRYLPRLAGSST